MEKRFKSLSIFKFQAMFPNGDKCKEYLAGLKWAHYFSCLRFEHLKPFPHLKLARYSLH